MKILCKLLLAMTMLFAFSGMTFAKPSPDSYHIEFVQLKEAYDAGDKIKLAVETVTSGDTSHFKLSVEPVEGGNRKDKVTDVETSYKKSTFKYTTTGYLTPSSPGTYLVTYQAKHRSFAGEKLLEATTLLTIKNPNEITMQVSPDVATVSLGKEVPLLITASSRAPLSFTYPEGVTELYTEQVSNIYKKVVLVKADKKGEFTIKIKARSKYDSKTETVKVIVK